MHIRRPKQFVWHLMDDPRIKRQTIWMELEYDVLDREFHCSVKTRGSPHDHYVMTRPATAEELAIARAHLTIDELARCAAESINPSIWVKAAKAAAAKKAATVQQLTNFKLTLDTPQS